MTPQDKIKELAELDGWLDVKEYVYTYDYAGESGELKQLQGREPTNLAVLRGVKNYLESYDAIIPLIQKQPPEVKELLGYFNLCETPAELSNALLIATGRMK